MFSYSSQVNDFLLKEEKSLLQAYQTLQNRLNAVYVGDRWVAKSTEKGNKKVLDTIGKKSAEV